jgi:hypothetical protein
MSSETWSSAVIAHPEESYEEWVIRMRAWDEELPEVQSDSEDVDEDFIGGSPDPSEVDEDFESEEVFEAENVDDDKDADEDTDSF